MQHSNSRPFRTVHGQTVQYHFDPKSPCPCDSGRPASSCCLSADGFFRLAAMTSPPGPLTGTHHPKCYASALGDCSSKISREHFVSANLLHALSAEGGLHLGGLRWQAPAQLTRLPPRALASNILCERHNSALSPLDSIADRLFRSFDERSAAASGLRVLHLFSGHDVERWLLKVLCGLVAGMHLSGTDSITPQVPQGWLEVLFCKAEFAPGQGLYMCSEPGEVLEGPTGLLLTPLLRRDSVTGLKVSVCGYDLVLALDLLQDQTRKLAYRPMELHATGRDFEKSILFSWRGSADLGTISVSIAEA